MSDVIITHPFFGSRMSPDGCGYLAADGIACGRPALYHQPTLTATPAYVPQVGDRVRVVIEGEVLAGATSYLLYISTPGAASSGAVLYHGLQREHVTSIERLPDPLPTTPGSVVRFGSDHLRFLSRAGWLTEYGEKVEADFPATVLFDAGATP